MLLFIALKKINDSSFLTGSVAPLNVLGSAF